MTEKQLDKIREQFEKMDNEFWRDLSKELLEAGNEFQSNPNPITELKAERARIEFDIWEIRYNGYKDILDKPNMASEITKKVKKYIDEKQTELKFLEINMTK